MSQKNLVEYSITKPGKKLGGGAAQLARIKRFGGWDAYHEKFAKEVAKKVVAEILEDMNRPSFKRVK